MNEFEELLKGYEDPKRFYQCQSKKLYSSEDEAKMAAYHFERKKGKPFRFYKCDFCAKFHLTTKLERRKENDT